MPLNELTYDRQYSEFLRDGEWRCRTCSAINDDDSCHCFDCNTPRNQEQENIDASS